MKTTLLIDADVVAYQATCSVEVATHWGDGYWTWHCDETEVREVVRDQIDRYMETLGGDAYKLCLTDSDGNFRKTVLPAYKGNRASVKKPLVLQSVKQWMIDELDAYYRPGLEGDDCMGILATASQIKGQKVIVSIDKDMKTIPGFFYRDVKDAEMVEISLAEADYWHLYQTLTGDTTDGYAGCPGIGPKGAEKILGLPEDFTSVAETWPLIVEAYVKAGLNETEALVQARVARILRASDYDFKKEPILWNP